MPGQISGFSVAYTAVGGILLWSGIKGDTISATLKSVLAGQVPSAGTETIGTPELSVSSNPQSTAASGSSTSPISTNAGTSATAAANQAIAKLLALQYGWSTGTQWDALVQLWQGESSWSNTAQNSASGAFGIPQALPYSKMPKAAWPVSAGGSSSATVQATAQITWGLAYIKSEYGTPSAALAYDTSHGGY